MCALSEGNIMSQITRQNNIYVPRDRKGNINMKKLQRPVLEIKNMSRQFNWYSLYLYLPKYSNKIVVFGLDTRQKIFPAAKKLRNILGADVIKT